MGLSLPELTDLPAGKTASRVLFFPGCSHLLTSPDVTGYTESCVQQGSWAPSSLALGSHTAGLCTARSLACGWDPQWLCGAAGGVVVVVP